MISGERPKTSRTCLQASDGLLLAPTGPKHDQFVVDEGAVPVRGEARVVSVEIEIAEGAAYVTFSGVLTAVSWGEAYRELQAHAQFVQDLPTVWDFRAATGINDLTAGDFRAFSEFVGKVRGSGTRPKVAMIASQDLEFGIARMYELGSKDKIPIHLGVFRNSEDAVEWIKGR